MRPSRGSALCFAYQNTCQNNYRHIIGKAFGGLISFAYSRAPACTRARTRPRIRAHTRAHTRAPLRGIPYGQTCRKYFLIFFNFFLLFKKVFISLHHQTIKTKQDENAKHQSRRSNRNNRANLYGSQKAQRHSNNGSQILFGASCRLFKLWGY